MKLVIGVWSANPRINEIKPSDTTAVYQFANNIEIKINASANATISL